MWVSKVMILLIKLYRMQRLPSKYAILIGQEEVGEALTQRISLRNIVEQNIIFDLK